MQQTASRMIARASSDHAGFKSNHEGFKSDRAGSFRTAFGPFTERTLDRQ